MKQIEFSHKAALEKTTVVIQIKFSPKNEHFLIMYIQDVFDFLSSVEEK